MAMEQVKSECYPISILPRLSRLFLDFVERRDALAPFYPASAYSTQWMTSPAVLPPEQRETLCDLLEQQNRAFGATDPVYRKHRASAQRGRRGGYGTAGDALWRPAIHHP